jgi:hypothetical protein
MGIEAKKHSQQLEKGQLWKIENGYVYIVELGKRLIQYKMLKQPHQKAVTTRLIAIAELLAYLKRNGAELMTGVSAG